MNPDKPTACDRCGASRLVLGSAAETRDGVRVHVVCELCGGVMTATTTERIEAVRTWYTEN